jgi:hypothetical protein
MKKLSILTAAAFTTLLAGAALAGNVSNVTQDSPNAALAASATIDQTGSNFSDVTQFDFADTKVTQSGAQNSAKVWQQGDDGSLATANQSFAVVWQLGNGNQASISQDNTDAPPPWGNSATITQTGDSNVGSSSQNGDHNTSNITQTGIGNQASTVVNPGAMYSARNTQDILQDGDFNVASASAVGWYNTGLINQDGIGNEATLEQLGDSNWSLTKQTGTRNIAFTSQAGLTNVSTITQNGAGNRATVTQR